MKLYTYFRSSTSYRLRIALACKKLNYEAEYVSLPQMEHRSPEYLRINPQGLLPTLIDDDGTVVTQSLAILEYLDARYPEPPLLPTGLSDITYVREIAQIIACEIHPVNNVRVLKYLTETLHLPQESKNQWYQHWIAEGLSKVEDFLKLRNKHDRYCLDDQLSIADICLVPQIFNAQRFNCPLDDYANIMRIYDNCMQLSVFTAASPARQADAF